MATLLSRISFLLLYLLLATMAFSQSEPAGLVNKLTSFTTSITPEKLFLHSDKDAYTAGEILWFKMYVVDGIYHKPVSVSKVAYVEIIDRSNKPVYQAKVQLAEKGGHGSLQLPFGLQSGHYTLRAYTNWMKNLGAEHFFEKELVIVNTLKSPEPVLASANLPSYTLHLYPEGGNMVTGLPARVAFHVTDRSGKGIGGKGYLLNAKNDTLARFTPYKFGMGHFDLTPQVGMAYHVAFATEAGTLVTQALPTSQALGYTMQVTEENDNITVVVRTNAAAQGSEVYMLAQTRQVVKASQRKAVVNGEASFILDKKALDEGVSQITVFDPAQKPVCERLFFRQPTGLLSPEIVASKATYSTREKVTLSFKETTPDPKNMSLSVYLLDGLQGPEAATIQQYLYLTSELSGTIEQPAFYFSGPDASVKKAADYLMLTHGWRRFSWEPVLNGRVAALYPMEYAGHIITGKVTDTRTNAAAPNVQVFLSVPQTAGKLYTAVSDRNGMVQFPVKDYYESGEIVLQTASSLDSFYAIEVLSPFAEAYTNKIAYPASLPATLQASLVNRSIAMQAQHLYRPEQNRRFVAPVIDDTLPFYGRAPIHYKLDDYVRFNTMEEVLREYVREIFVGVKGSGASLRFKLYDQTRTAMRTDNLLVMVDGVPLANPNYVFTMDPLKVKRLDIIPQNYVFGNATFYGLVNFSSYNGRYEGLELAPGAITVDYEGLQLQRRFYAPEYATEQERSSRLPDLRTTLFWMPELAAGEASFYTGDNKGRYLIVLQGIDALGRTISSSTQIDVK